LVAPSDKTDRHAVQCNEENELATRIAEPLDGLGVRAGLKNQRPTKSAKKLDKVTKSHTFVDNFASSEPLTETSDGGA
jgi:hypothetical protein